LPRELSSQQFIRSIILLPSFKLQRIAVSSSYSEATFLRSFSCAIHSKVDCNFCKRFKQLSEDVKQSNTGGEVLRRKSWGYSRMIQTLFLEARSSPSILSLLNTFFAIIAFPSSQTIFFLTIPALYPLVTSPSLFLWKGILLPLLRKFKFWGECQPLLVLLRVLRLLVMQQHVAFFKKEVQFRKTICLEPQKRGTETRSLSPFSWKFWDQYFIWSKKSVGTKD
jgi:hypothetical protein